MFPARWPRLLANLLGDEIFLITLSSARFLQFPRKNRPFPVSSAVNCLDFAATVTAFSCPLTYAGENGRMLLAGSNSPPSESSRIWVSLARRLWHYFFHFWPLVQTLGRGPTVVSVEFLHALIPRKGSGSTTTSCWQCGLIYTLMSTLKQANKMHSSAVWYWWLFCLLVKTFNTKIQSGLNKFYISSWKRVINHCLVFINLNTNKAIV